MRYFVRIAIDSLNSKVKRVVFIDREKGKRYQSNSVDYYHSISNPEDRIYWLKHEEGTKLIFESNDESLFKKILSIHSNNRYYIIKRPLSEVIEKLNIAEHIL